MTKLRTISFVVRLLLDRNRLPTGRRESSLPVVADVDSAVVSVRLSVDAGRIVAANGPGGVVAGTPAARTFTGTPAAMTAYFAALGRIRYASAANDFGDRTLRIEASDRVAATEIVRRICVTPVNDAPTIAAATAFAEGRRNTPFEITHDMLLARSGARDIDAAPLAFRVESVARGSLQRWNGARWVNFVVRNDTPAAQRLIGPGQRIRWVPPPAPSARSPRSRSAPGTDRRPPSCSRG